MSVILIIGHDGLHFLGQTAFTMGVPGNRAVGRIRPKTNPFVAGGTEDTVGLELSDVRVCPEVRDTLLLGALSATALGRWIRKRFGGTLRSAGVNHGGTPRGTRSNAMWVTCK